MAEVSMLWTTNNVGHGPSSGYASGRWQALLRKLMQSDLAASGSVMFGVDNQLAVTGAATPLAMNTGAALVYGFFYENDASKNLAVTTPVVGTTGGRVILRADYAAQTVTAVVKMSTDGVSAFPALTQNPGVTYEIPLYNFTVTTGGVITLTDVRSFSKASIRVYGAQLDPAIVDNSTIEINANVIRVKDTGITGAKLNANVADAVTIERSGTTLRIKDAGVTTPKIADAAVTTVKIADLNVTLGKLANDSVDDTKAGNRVPQFIRRQGGDASNWETAGTTNFTPGAVRVQWGSVNVPFSGVNTVGSAVVTFPIAFSNDPLVFCTLGVSTDTNGNIIHNVGTDNASNSGFNPTARRATTTGGAGSIVVNWFAIGPE